ncbi:hypothetical protein HMPREF0793_0188 [Staphylococcus caprae M23864:W1]|uniref:Phage protein n=2 Tax=Staphylococcus TaxID=1279 RepID=A0A292DGY9_STALU|nr:hypothetical protein AL499_06450 [Staphylococcus lugdunensis]EES42133.1 hypothetical protein HMPREF0793_0188 [Staphylococcus caprae M23864:W1]EFU84265.1 hypothetical protein HMPREF0790_0892 [Staphylococcus lugdunensis M23590]OFN84504.1 hypothetical protein HMPREF2718_01750 [Staphylococcus sp. HMSC077C04]OFP64421.1 hypothetical protein HMPREF2977_09550 [Staphylococcus sp. HMSC068G03]OFQ36071.1 hypothetical protein HMPREF2940_07500 [Staphylococcus sp. HMSC073C12]OHO82338.1 hypothetical prote
MKFKGVYYMKANQYEELSEVLDLTESQKLKLYVYQERQNKNIKQDSKESKQNNEEANREKRQKILDIKDDVTRQNAIAKNRELFK